MVIPSFVSAGTTRPESETPGTLASKNRWAIFRFCGFTEKETSNPSPGYHRLSILEHLKVDWYMKWLYNISHTYIAGVKKTSPCHHVRIFSHTEDCVSMFKGLPPRQIELLSSAIAEQTVLHGFMMDSWFTSSLCWIPESSWAGAMDFPWIFPRAAVQPNRTQCLTLDVLCRYQLERRPDWYIRWDATNDAGIGSW